MEKCKNCARQYFCKEVDTKEECNNFKSWKETKNYGEVKRIENTRNIYKQ